MNKNIEKEFFDSITDARLPATIITVNGFQMRGFIEGHDLDTILVDVCGRKQLVYKSDISTIIEGEEK